MNKQTEAGSIDEVIEKLAIIIEECRKEENPLGYFAVLYQKVTMTVRDKIGQHYFEDDARMERLDVVFANRYIAAYKAYKAGKLVTKSWENSFVLGKSYWLIVFQHLLLGMNAHINLDLGIAAAEITTKETIDDLEEDFNKINELLSTLVGNVQENLCLIWPRLVAVLKMSKKIDDLMVDFSMNIARNGAWKFANELVGKTETEKEVLIAEQDESVAKLTHLIAHKGMVLKMVFGIIRLGEKGSVTVKISKLER